MRGDRAERGGWVLGVLLPERTWGHPPHRRETEPVIQDCPWAGPSQQRKTPALLCEDLAGGQERVRGAAVGAAGAAGALRTAGSGTFGELGYPGGLTSREETRAVAW